MTAKTTTLLAAMLHADSAMPSGTFAFSWGLEELYDDDLVREDQPFAEILQWYLRTRWVDYERYFIYHSCTATPDERRELDLLYTTSSTSAAGRGSSVRAGRSMLMAWSRIGTAAVSDYLDAVRAGSAEGNLVIVQGLVYGEHGMNANLASAVSGWTFLSNLASAAVRMGRVSASSAQRSLSETLPMLSELMDKPLPDAPFSWGAIQDIAMERHALRNARLFAS